MTGILNLLAGSISSAIKDGYFNLVTLLLPGNGTNGAQNNTFLDSSTANAGSGWTITRNGNTTQGTFSPFSQTGWSVFFNGSEQIDIAASTTQNLGTSDFTYECFWYATTISSRQSLVCSASDYWFGIDYQSDGKGLGLWASSNGTSWNIINSDAAGNGITSTSPNLYQWNHIAVSRTGGTWSMWLNGTRILNLTGLTASVVARGSETKRIGKWAAAYNNPVYGYISNSRLVVGSYVYTPGAATITVPTTALSNITNTAWLTLNANRFVDGSNNSLAISVGAGTPSVQAFSPFAPTAAYSASTNGGSGYFDGAGDYLQLPVNSIPFGANDFTVEGWVYRLSTSAACFMIGQTDQASNANSSFNIYLNTGSSSVYVGSTSYDVTSPSPVANAWAHIAFVRTGGNLSTYLNGARVATIATLGTSSVNNGTASSYPPTIFSFGSGINQVNGYLGGLRIIVGSGGYDATSSTITVPTSPFTATANTKVLLNCTNAGITDATAKNDLETVGNAQISTTQSKFGGSSMYFDGTGDWLTVIDNPNLQMGSGDFTIEGWFYLSATGVAYGIVSKGTSTTGWSVNVTSGNKLQFSYTSSNLTGATTLSSATWYYFAVVRSGTATGNLKIYLNGSADATSAGAVTDNFNQTSIMYVGADRVGTSALNGYIDDLRITKGYARTITTPTSAFPVQ